MAKITKKKSNVSAKKTKPNSVKKLAKKSVSTKKSVTKKTAPKNTVSKAEAKAVEQKPTLIEAASVPVSVLPTRAPTRRIIGSNNTITIVPKPTSPALRLPTTASPTPAQETKPIHTISQPKSGDSIVLPKIEMAQVPVQPVKVAPQIKIEPKLPWSKLPANIPAQVRFMVQAAEQECAKAAGSPFPFAKFMATLPQEICGREFALLVLNLEHSQVALSTLCEINPEQLEAYIESGNTILDEKFASACPEIYRKIRIQLVGNALGIESMIERYLISGVNQDLQILIATILRQGMERRAQLLAAV